MWSSLIVTISPSNPDSHTHLLGKQHREDFFKFQFDFRVLNRLLPARSAETDVQDVSSSYVLVCLVLGDEVLQWNGKSLPGATKKEVYNIILESKAEPQVEIVVSRPIG